MERIRNVRNIRVMCNLLFALFAFVYLYFFHSDFLRTILIYINSVNKSWMSILLALLFVLLLFGFRYLTNRALKCEGILYSLSFYPSCLVLGTITNYKYYLSFADNIKNIWIWFTIVSIAIFIFIKLALKHSLRNFINKRRGKFVILNYNLFILIVLSLTTIYIGNDNILYHNIVDTENAISDKDYRLARSITDKLFENSRDLTVLRNFSLLKESKSGEYLFDFPQKYGVKGLFFDCNRDNLNAINNDSIASFLGVNKIEFINKIAPRDFISENDSNKVAYFIAYKLLSKDISDLQSIISKYYNIRSINLPKHYKEALLLSHYLKNNGEILKIDDQKEIDLFKDFIKKRNNIYKIPLKKKELFMEYGNTYWWYYINQ